MYGRLGGGEKGVGRDILCGQHEGVRDEIQMNEASILVAFRQNAASFLAFAAVPLDIFHHAVFACKFAMVREVVHNLIVVEPEPFLRLEQAMYLT